MKNNVKKLCISAVLVALSTALSLVKVLQMPLGGSITLFSMVPLSLIGIMFGSGYAILPCFLYGAIQMFLGGVFGWGLTPTVLVFCILLDYLGAYTVFCLSGIFKKNKNFGVLLGVTLGMFLRFCCHFVSGIFLWKSFEVFNNPVIYSLFYNGGYMLPEMIITSIGTYFICKTSLIKRLSSL